MTSYALSNHAVSGRRWGDCCTGPPDDPIGEWNVAQVTNMLFMFGQASAFNGDLSKWNVGKFMYMRNMCSVSQIF